MIECSHCGQQFIPTSEDLNICPHCGHANGVGILHLSTEEELSEEDQFSERSLVRTMGKLALLILLLGGVALFVYGYLAMDDIEQQAMMTAE